MTLLIKRLSTQAPGFPAALQKLLAYEQSSDAEVHASVRGIIDAVRQRGDVALVEYTNRFDRRSVVHASEFAIGNSELARARADLSAEMRDSLEAATERIRAYHDKQRAESWTYVDPLGVTLGQQVTPLDRVGVYVPGGKAAYPSSVLMNIIPAKVAGVGEVIMVVPAPDGKVNPLVLAAAAIAGADRVFTVGGAQAVAALAYGTETVPQVDKIVGPGNIYVAVAKAMVFGTVGIDMIAGPSEILVVCDGKTDPDWIAMDLMSQAEHDEQAQAILLSPDLAFLDRVQSSLERLLPTMERQTIIRTSLSDRGGLIHTHSLDDAIAVVNDIAPEHLELSVEDPFAWAKKVRHAGAIFLGRHTAEALGDYCAGPNHVLPTARTARFSSPLGVYDFQKRSSLIFCSPAASAELGRTASVLARGEGLTAHAKSAEFRIGNGTSVG